VTANSSKGVENWLRNMKGCTVFHDSARFEGPKEVRVGAELLSAPRIFINVGGRANVPDLPGLNEISYLTNVSILELERVPQHLVVIGGTYKTLCAHHILPFFGQFIIGYIPQRMIIGASKIPRIVEVHMRRLQSQEHLAHDVADTIERILEPVGLAVWMGGVHMCMVMRGVEQESSFMETNVLRGEFRQDEKTREEFMSIVNRRGQRG